MVQLSRSAMLRVSSRRHVLRVTGVTGRRTGQTDPMADFEVHLDSPLSAPEAWRRILDLRAHTAVIPLTTVTGAALSAAELGPGSRFVARTGLGPIGFDDTMVVESIVP